MHTEQENRKVKIKLGGSRENAHHAEHEPTNLSGVPWKQPGFNLGPWDPAPEVRESSRERGKNVASDEQTQIQLVFSSDPNSPRRLAGLREAGTRL